MIQPLIGISAYPRMMDIVPAPTLLHTVSRFYVDSVVRAGGCPVILPAVDPALAPVMLANLDGLLLPGGGDVGASRYGEVAGPESGAPDEVRDAWELACARTALDLRLPLLAICRGCQLLNVSLGGSLIQDIPTATGMRHGFASRYAEAVHPVRLDPSCGLSRLFGRSEIDVNSLHHQAVGRLGRDVRAIGWAPDGTIEAIEVDGRPEVLAVQWHPELLEEDPLHQSLFAELVALSVTRVAEARIIEI